MAVTRPTLVCKHCGGDVEDNAVYVRIETAQVVCGDGYSWDRIVLVDAGVFCSRAHASAYLGSAPTVTKETP